MRFEQQQIVITGAVKGLVRRYALALAQRGAQLILVDRYAATCDEVSELLAHISALGGRAEYLFYDYYQKDNCDLLLLDIKALTPKVAALIHGACVHDELRHAEPGHLALQWQVEIMFSLQLTQAIWPLMQAQRYGRIVMMTSVSGLYGDSLRVNESVTKMAVVGMVNSLAQRGATIDIHVNSLCGLAVTELPEQHLAARVKPIFACQTPVAALLFLASSQAPNGQHFLAAAGSVSHGMFVEYPSEYFTAEQCTPEVIARHWSELGTKRSPEVLVSAESKICAWTTRGAKEHDIKLT
ncbi:SDR family NAD(P)-dependent oxidoreductase [Shewanella sp. NIFS-20-20]|uniref:SDR family NAD(P)-dependent oxidoreductase n=1 Tax=Shewanella sp. NIFS-20-20 TaxID=2853806 RepID=UPI001C455F23|nr:SDR family oxidoreductase [Shewanella sp. NIFS-20-20]MBV7316798.1 SDR family oxidoreductase [Shewanella sp. NIFS-20-20]